MLSTTNIGLAKSKFKQQTLNMNQFDNELEKDLCQKFIVFLYKKRNYQPEDLSDIANIPLSRIPQTPVASVESLTLEDLKKIKALRSLLNKDPQVVF